MSKHSPMAFDFHVVLVLVSYMAKKSAVVSETSYVIPHETAFLCRLSHEEFLSFLCRLSHKRFDNFPPDRGDAEKA